ncbi:hypothetical protein M378DRAFT_1041638 [Amanita muscaria Koide BX008]|uniref:Uncharacterized protein n=1 Tax=Amanita muscaria (strain Koide BX008) TaxID=946122 RepID=A0A0C2W3F1_AMAMK|nr:hypothetical protein M378DRAFT_1041638 [Amanita muscaria Koide BX008]
MTCKRQETWVEPLYQDILQILGCPQYNAFGERIIITNHSGTGIISACSTSSSWLKVVEGQTVTDSFNCAWDHQEEGRSCARAGMHISIRLHAQVSIRVGLIQKRGAQNPHSRLRTLVFPRRSNIVRMVDGRLERISS